MASSSSSLFRFLYSPAETQVYGTAAIASCNLLQATERAFGLPPWLFFAPMKAMPSHLGFFLFSCFGPSMLSSSTRDCIFVSLVFSTTPAQRWIDALASFVYPSHKHIRQLFLCSSRFLSFSVPM